MHPKRNLRVASSGTPHRILPLQVEEPCIQRQIRCLSQEICFRFYRWTVIRLLRWKEYLEGSTAHDFDTTKCYCLLEDNNDLKKDYQSYFQSDYKDVDKQLLGLNECDYETTTALFTLLLREDHFCNGIFQERVKKGQVKSILERMILLLEEETKDYTD